MTDAPWVQMEAQEPSRAVRRGEATDLRRGQGSCWGVGAFGPRVAAPCAGPLAPCAWVTRLKSGSPSPPPEIY